MIVDLIIIFREQEKFRHKWMWAFTASHCPLKCINLGYSDTVSELACDVREKIVDVGYELNVVIAHRGGIEKESHPGFWTSDRIISPTMLVIDDIWDDANFAVLRLAFS